MAIFKDNINEQEERLQEARLRLKEVRGEGRRRGPRPALEDAQRKIERQERRVRVLEVFYKEQVGLFRDTRKGQGFNMSLSKADVEP